MHYFSLNGFHAHTQRADLSSTGSHEWIIDLQMLWETHHTQIKALPKKRQLDAVEPRRAARPCCCCAYPAASAAAARIKIPGTLSPKGMGGNTSTRVKASWERPDNQTGTVTCVLLKY